MQGLAGMAYHALWYHSYVISEEVNLKDDVVLACGSSLRREDRLLKIGSGNSEVKEELK